MEFALSKEQKEYRREIIGFAKEYLNDESNIEVFSYDLWKRVSEFGLLGITIDEKYGGLHESYQTAAVAFEALGYACKDNGFIFVINNHIWVCQNMISLFGSELLKEKYLPCMVCGEKIGTIAITEAEAGSDALSMSTVAVKVEGGYQIKGNKMFISNGPIADIFLVFAKLENADGNKIGAFVIEKSFDGVSTGPNIEKMGLNACPTSELILDNVFVPEENVLGKVENGANILTSAIEWERCFEFVPHIGVMQRVMEKCNQYANERMQFGKSIKEYQAVSHKIADMKIRIEMAKLLMMKIAWLKDRGKSAFSEVSMFKIYVSENYIQTCKDAMQIFGAYGYTKEYGLEREMRDALACSVYSGTNEIQRNTIFRCL